MTRASSTTLSGSSLYRHFSRLKEEPDPSFFELNEKWVQRLWFEEVYRSPLVTTTGEHISIQQPGFWNFDSGPDFQQACLINGRGETEVGSVEIHLTSTDWLHHRHDTNPHYDNVILHLVWSLGPKNFFPRTSQTTAIRQVELCSQLRLPFTELRSLFTSLPIERKVGARIGICKQELDQLDDGEITSFLEEAGWYRFHSRVRLWSLRCKLLGFDQTLWQGLAEALGYSQNKQSFKYLSQRLPLRTLFAMPSHTKREACLFGLSGFLPHLTLPAKKQAHEWTQTLWKSWWSLRHQHEPHLLTLDHWNFKGLRPTNRPERRLAILSLLSSPQTWKTFIASCHSSSNDATHFLSSLSHSFWDDHFTLHRHSNSSIALLGEGRIQNILYNVIWPLLYPQHPERIENELRKARTPLTNKSSRIAATRLLGTRTLKQSLNRTLIQEGLIQVYQDFCLNDFHQCQQCDLPNLVRQWKNPKTKTQPFCV